MSNNNSNTELEPCPLRVVENAEGTWDILIDGALTHPRLTQWTKSSAEEAVRLIDEAYRSRASVAAPQAVTDGISWTALLACLERLRSKTRNLDAEWYHGWNAAIQCLINDVNARSLSPVSPFPTPEQTCKCGLPKDDPIHSYTTEWQQMHTFIPKSAPPSTQPSARVAAEEIQDWNQYGEGKGSYEADVAYIESIITKHCFPSGQPVEEAPDPCAVAGFHVCGPKDGELRKHVESYIGSTDAVREDS